MDSRLEEANNAKTIAMDQVEANANRDYLDFMFNIVELVCLRLKHFTTDDVVDLYDLAINEDKPTTHEPRALGPVMMRAAKAGYCRKANVAPRPSRRKSLHASPRAVWESMLCR